MSVALLLVGIAAIVMPLAASGILTTALSSVGTLACLLALFLRMQATSFSIPIGPPGLSLYFALDPLAMLFLVIIFLTGTAVAAFQATTVARTRVESPSVTAICVAGTALSVLAADGVALALSLSAICAVTGRNTPQMLVPILILAGVCLLTPAGYAPRFDAIRAAPIDPDHATAAAALTIAAAGGLIWPPRGERCWTRDVLIAGVLIPLESYLLLRLIADLSGAAVQAWWGVVLLLGGGLLTIIHGWRSAAVPDIDVASGALMQRQAWPRDGRHRPCADRAGGRPARISRLRARSDLPDGHRGKPRGNPDVAVCPRHRRECRHLPIVPPRRPDSFHAANLRRAGRWAC